jgi:DNA-binding response OmpR family regulator
MTSTILIVEDDQEIHELLVTCLQKEGYETASAYDGEEALDRIARTNFELVIMDLMLPKMDGYEVLRRMRETRKIPVLILSAKGAEVDKMLGLGLGADDYVTKPFGVGELTARVKAMLRRYLYFNHNPNDIHGVPTHNLPTHDLLTHGDLTINLHTYEVISQAGKTMLTAKEFDILKLFLSNPTRIFTKSHIYRAIWNEDLLSDENTVMVHIRRIRIKIETDPSQPQYIQTVWGIGYRLGEVTAQC